MTHASPPEICQDCVLETEQKSREVKGIRPAATFCAHHGGALAIVTIKDGEIFEWTISTCGSIEEALRKAKVVAGDALDDMMSDESTKRQH